MLTLLLLKFFNFHTSSPHGYSVIFEPIPYSTESPHGMPKDISDKYYMKENYAIVNVPQTIMFKAKVFAPTRLCAVYQVTGMSEEFKEKLAMQTRRKSQKSGENGNDNPWDGMGEAIKRVWQGDDGSGLTEEELDEFYVV
jgi:hypothetical protein